MEMEKVREVIEEQRLEDHLSDRKGVKTAGLMEEMKDAKNQFDGRKKEIVSR